MLAQKVGHRLQVRLVSFGGIAQPQAAPAKRAEGGSGRCGARDGAAVGFVPKLALVLSLVAVEDESHGKMRIQTDGAAFRKRVLQVVECGRAACGPLQRQHEPGIDLRVQIDQQRRSVLPGAVAYGDEGGLSKRLQVDDGLGMLAISFARRRVQELVRCPGACAGTNCDKACADPEPEKEQHRNPVPALETFAHGIQGTGADIPENNTQGGQGQTQQTGRFAGRPVCIVLGIFICHMACPGLHRRSTRDFRAIGKIRLKIYIGDRFAIRRRSERPRRWELFLASK